MLNSEQIIAKEKRQH